MCVCVFFTMLLVEVHTLMNDDSNQLMMMVRMLFEAIEMRNKHLMQLDSLQNLDATLMY